MESLNRKKIPMAIVFFNIKTENEQKKGKIHTIQL